MGFPIRRADVEDAPVVARLLHDFNSEFGEPEPTAEEFAARFARLLARDDVLVLLAGDTGEETGFAFLTLRPTPYWDGPLAHLEELYVVPLQRGHGIGTDLMDAAERIVVDAGSRELHISVDSGDTDTRRFYERRGYRHTSPAGDDEYLLYERSLG